MHYFFSEAEENVEIEKMHGSQYQDNEAYLDAQLFYYLLNIIDAGGYLQSINCITKVDKIKTHQQQVVHAVGQFFVAMKNIYQKYFTIFKQRTGHPNGKADGNK